MASTSAVARLVSRRPPRRPYTVFNAASCRTFASTSSPRREVVDLAFEKAERPKSSSGPGAPPVVVLHGLFGQKQNWRSLSKALAQSLNTDVYALDLRNHGRSPHHPEHNYRALVADVRHFFDTHDLKQLVLMGHSMGGKTASALALDPELPSDTLSSLIIVDVSPQKFSISTDFEDYLDAMKEIDAAEVPDGKTAMKMLAEKNFPLEIQHFLLTNLGGVQEGSKGRRFRIPLDILGDNLPNISDFPYEAGEATYNGRTLAIRGKRSDYVPDHRLDRMRQLFPNLQVATLDTSHWVHSEKPHEFMDVVKKFITEGQ